MFIGTHTQVLFLKVCILWLKPKRFQPILMKFSQKNYLHIGLVPESQINISARYMKTVIIYLK